MPFALSVEALLLTIKLSMCADRVKAVTPTARQADHHPHRL
jgi:hypothetical protein